MTRHPRQVHDAIQPSRLAFSSNPGRVGLGATHSKPVQSRSLLLCSLHTTAVTATTAAAAAATVAATAAANAVCAIDCTGPSVDDAGSAPASHPARAPAGGSRTSRDGGAAPAAGNTEAPDGGILPALEQHALHSAEASTSAPAASEAAR
eukprot:CAMPEP_0174727154 /NCGR_PEP_ID=MMETSP1094-20130205/49208_1 /TAXON_ID=156173 /ORGANISM="Chrysochromulina brevifilum, Strain UTEX LB 985" /LENGTH=149 /DNA_ID=CAMNT_0015928839 /DNA_START=269 /DNA_END=720 /DNA_ORIENTATION=-